MEWSASVSQAERDWFLRAIFAYRERLLVISPDYRILATNIESNRFDPGGMIGKPCHVVFHDRQEPCDHCPMREVRETGRPSLEASLTGTFSQGRVPCSFTYPIKSGTDVQAYVVLSFQLPPLHLVEERLHRSNAFLENLILSAVDCVIASDMTGKILIFSDSAVELFGYGTKEALERVDVRQLYEDGVAYEVMARLRSEDHGGIGKLKGYPVNVVTATGETIPIRLYASIVFEGHQEVATIGFFHDRRERLRMEKEMERTQIQLLQAEKMVSLGKLAAGVAHQLNNPLAGITLFTRIVLDEYELEERAQEDLRRVLKETNRCRDTVRELLEFSRQTRQRRQLHNLNDALRRTIFLLEGQVLFQNIRIEACLDESLPEIAVDVQQIYHVFMNVILNAAQAMDGQGELRVETQQLSYADMLRVTISDTGPGIPEDVLPRIFEPFFTTKEAGIGTGLGLSVAYGIMETHKGRIQAMNRPRGGASFIIDLPISVLDDGG